MTRYSEEWWDAKQANIARWKAEEAARSAKVKAARADAAPGAPSGASTDAATGGRPSKYRNTRSGAYASKREAKRASELRMMAEAGTIRNLREQVEYLLIPRQKRPDGTVAERACSYVADFVYEEFRDGSWASVTEDVKGMRTDVYRIKRKLMLFVHGVEVRET